MRLTYVFWVLFTAVASIPFFEQLDTELRYWFYLYWQRDVLWEPAFGPISERLLAMERNGTLRGPKVYIPNPGFELNMGKPWKLVGNGVEVAKNVSLSRRGRNSLLFTISDPVQRPEVYSVNLKNLKDHRVYYLTFNYRFVEMKGVTKKTPCFIAITLGDMIVTYPIFAKAGQHPHILRHEHMRYQSITVPMYSKVSISPLVIAVFCSTRLRTGDIARVSIDDIRLEKGEGELSSWEFDLPREKYQYWLRDNYHQEFQKKDAKWYGNSYSPGWPVNCREETFDGWKCKVAGYDYRRQDLWDEGYGDYWPLNEQPGRSVTDI
ncbi:hypothetical protein FPSE_05492 [Fusarium pseudograminearum CS3096]|uniref:Uncharacterized protein n=1 Tax=Fusarium pseudograminearum (strain CS3096) TaxID=1028729 RepID=K3UPU2_FUSPC|nr:hypothetical protein FPSE_05492 [Fusarium pseudograminearum CS3096]EKJ74346.1 hypothetical protein FPSE_05492 [Fusarium pseudograminearum CS3096]